MTIQPMGIECDQPFIPAHFQPASLVDLAASRGIDSHRLLRATGLFQEDILSGQRHISASQFLQLIGNFRQLMQADDSAFLLGQHWLPGHFGPASHALRHADTLHCALERLQALGLLLSPLLRPCLRVDEQHVYLYWLDRYGAGAQRSFLVEALMAAVTGICRWLSGQRLPWQFHLRHAQPRWIEQYWVHLGEDLRFDCPLDQMRLPRAYLTQSLLGSSVSAGLVAERESFALLAQLPAPCSLLDQLHDHLVEHLRHPLGLERVAEAFAMSPATLKRKLHKHGSHFQQQLDQARICVAVELYGRGLSNEEVAACLNFNDCANFRRSFKRWAGMLPSELRHLLCQ